MDLVIHLGDQVYADEAFKQGTTSDHSFSINHFYTCFTSLCYNTSKDSSCWKENVNIQKDQKFLRVWRRQLQNFTGIVCTVTSFSFSFSLPLSLQHTHFIPLWREFYRKTWNYPPTREVLASVPNLTIWVLFISTSSSEYSLCCNLKFFWLNNFIFSRTIMTFVMTGELIPQIGILQAMNILLVKLLTECIGSIKDK